MAIKNRKSRHLEICQSKAVEFENKTTLFKDIELVYEALPEIDPEEIDLSSKFLNWDFAVPFFVNSMTGGCDEAEKINIDIALACEEFNTGMSLGSIRALLEDFSLLKTYAVKKYAPSIFLSANIGMRQINKKIYGKLSDTLGKLEADALVIHINAAQEIIQGDKEGSYKNFLPCLKEFCETFPLPVYVKEVGNGISRETASKLATCKIAGLDVGGAGGTSWIKVDSILNSTEEKNRLFYSFGIPTAASICECRPFFPKNLVASGGIRNGLDIVKALLLGADITALALPVLLAQHQGGNNAILNYFKKLCEEIRTTMFLINASSIKNLKNKRVILSGELKNWLSQIKITKI